LKAREKSGKNDIPYPGKNTQYVWIGNITMQRYGNIHGRIIERKHDDITLPKFVEYEITHKEEHARIVEMKIRVVHYDKIRDTIVDFVCAHLQSTKECIKFNNKEILMRCSTIIFWVTILASISTPVSMAT